MPQYANFTDRSVAVHVGMRHNTKCPSKVKVGVLRPVQQPENVHQDRQNSLYCSQDIGAKSEL